MKKQIWSTISLLIIFVTNPIFGQNNTSSAKTILNKVSQKYSSYKTIQASYTLNVQQTNGSSYTDAGNLYVDRSRNRYHITAKNQDIISDSKNQWTIMKSEKEVEIAEAANDANSISPSNIFTFYNTGFNSALAKNEKSKGITLQVVLLTPIDSKKNYSKIKLRINPSSNLIYDVTVSEKSGNSYIYTLVSQTGNKALSNTLFAFNKSNYQGYEIVDLR